MKADDTKSTRLFYCGYQKECRSEGRTFVRQCRRKIGTPYGRCHLHRWDVISGKDGK